MKPKNILFLMGTYSTYGGVEIVSDKNTERLGISRNNFFLCKLNTV